MRRRKARRGRGKCARGWRRTQRPIPPPAPTRARKWRRNLSPDAFRLALGRRYNRAKKQGARTDLTSDQIDQKSTAERLAVEHAVGEATVRRAGKFAEEVEKTPEPGMI